MFQEIIQKEGATNLYRGVGSPLLAEAPKRAIKFGCNSQYNGFLKELVS